MTDICPKACDVRVSALEAWKAACIQDNKDTYKHWEEEVRKLTPQKTFFWLIGLLVIVLMGTFGVLYGQGNAVRTKLDMVREDQVVVQTTLKGLVRHAEREDDHRNGRTSLYDFRESDSAKE